MILVLNCGSQSIKWKLFERGLKLKKEGKRDVFDCKNYKEVLEEELNSLTKFDIEIVGHRVVAGGEKLRKPVKANEKVIEELKKFNKIAPLHNPFNILGIETARKVFKKAEQVAVFDTEFYANLPEKAYVYPIPEKIREKYGFRRFGFHGISHEYVAKEGAKTIKKPFNKIKIITCHLGGGTSITAIKNGKAVDTSMGYSPLEGVVMMTRCGNIDLEIVFELLEDYSVEEVKCMLNYESGLKGICGENNMLGVLNKIKKGDKKAKLALDIFVYKIKKYIGACYAILDGCDLLVFTGTIGYGSSKIRNLICKNSGILKNTKVLAVKTDEELAIASKIKRI
jgi:acetate kinase